MAKIAQLSCWIEIGGKMQGYVGQQTETKSEHHLITPPPQLTHRTLVPSTNLTINQAAEGSTTYVEVGFLAWDDTLVRISQQV